MGITDNGLKSRFAAAYMNDVASRLRRPLKYKEGGGRRMRRADKWLRTIKDIDDPNRTPLIFWIPSSAAESVCLEISHLPRKANQDHAAELDSIDFAFPHRHRQPPHRRCSKSQTRSSAMLQSATRWDSDQIASAYNRNGKLMPLPPVLSQDCIHPRRSESPSKRGE